MAEIKLAKIVFLCSGGGGNLRFIFEAIKNGWLKGVEIAAVLTDRECPASRFAASAGLPVKRIDFGLEGQRYLLEELIQIDPELIITTVHKILTRPIVERFNGKLINLHYSLLPAFGGLIGMQSVSAALDFGTKFGGVTVHLVDESVDGGRPIIQAAFPIRQIDRTPDDISELVFRCGCLALLSGINRCLHPSSSDLSSYIEVIGTPCMFNGGVLEVSSAIADEGFWKRISLKY